MEAMRVAIISSPALAAVQNVQSEEWVREWVLAVCQEDGPGEAPEDLCEGARRTGGGADCTASAAGCVIVWGWSWDDSTSGGVVGDLKS